MHFLLTKKLKYFMTVMEKKCLTKASEDLFITRSPLGKTINELETLLGEKLFMREHGLYEPTPFAQELYEHALPLYQRLIYLENYFINSAQGKYVNVLLDEAFPDNVADVLISCLSKSEYLLHIHRVRICQDDLDNISPDTLIISIYDFCVEGDIVNEQTYSSTLLLIVNKMLRENEEGLSKVPLLIRSNMAGIANGILTACLQKNFGFTPKIRCVNGTVFDSLLMVGKGSGIMLLPIRTCELMNINRDHTIMLDNLKFKVNYYYGKVTKNRKEINNIIKHINTLF